MDRASDAAHECAGLAETEACAAATKAVQLRISAINCEYEALREENTKLRLMLATSIAGSRGYFDDGEMQDSSRMPMIDFKRFTPDQIRNALAERAAIAIKEQSNVPR